ncbi:MAG: uroporphyrinogen-III C-methyltransferase [Candidatus Eremiobacteraeota bacterium]|nr:uroporphyrinogen-III C-methyltransferase [Candidatus Eremiobacteraeota bacterium]
MSSGRVILTGAGPGDPGLLTLRAAEALRKADVLLYDALASDAIVSMAPPHCEKVFVGKRGGNHAMHQDDIEALMVRKARDGKTVVRLKGGDPFVFARGGEEAQTLVRESIPFEVVPGVTSAIAAPAYAGIPVTHRDFNVAFTVATGHEDPVKAHSTLDWTKLADPHQTLVLLMAMANLREIAAQLRANGLPADRPVAVIREGTRPQQITAVGTLETIADEVERAGIGAPAIVIIGDVVRLRDELRWFDRAPLFGKRVLVTRPAHQQEEFAAALRAFGAEPISLPMIEITEAQDPTEALDILNDLKLFGWIVFTSANGVDVFFRNLHESRKDARAIGTSRVAAIGPATADRLRAYGIVADLIPPHYIAEEIAAALLPLTQQGERILIYRAEVAREELVESLRNAQREPRVVAAYATRSSRAENFLERVQACDVITFTSASTVNGFVQNAGDETAARNAARGKIIACIGPVTAAAAHAAGLEVAVVADEFTSCGLIEALLRHCETAPVS